MRTCSHCGVPSVSFWTTRVALCQNCEKKVKDRLREEEQKLKDALLFVEALTNPQDRLRYLQEAVDSLRALTAAERLGYASVEPDVRASVLAQWMSLQSQSRQSAADHEDSLSEQVQTVTVMTSPGFGKERRRDQRTRQALPVRLGKERIRALAVDRSPRGVCIHAPVYKRPGTCTGVILHMPQRLIAEEGVVRWARAAGLDDLERGPCLMGIEFTGVRQDRQQTSRQDRTATTS